VSQLEAQNKACRTIQVSIIKIKKFHEAQHGEPQTNNLREQWNNGFQKTIVKHHPSLCRHAPMIFKRRV
jgi:hypothetical protein